MTNERHPRETTPSPKTAPSREKTIPAHEVGVTLTVSKKALEEIDRIQEEAMRAAQESQKLFWR